jgi:hypothetical protein
MKRLAGIDPNPRRSGATGIGPHWQVARASRPCVWPMSSAKPALSEAEGMAVLRLWANGKVAHYLICWRYQAPTVECANFFQLTLPKSRA